ncbi:MAG TPA: FAD/NAD(P)-binding protein [Anaerolineae bacterium]|nr:FAD/NAD(P)-binding protein [Anaerolineae bacterium]HNU05736.1 FAD/NAD(P)-binding protein [Anaerolineae bacterium]
MMKPTTAPATPPARNGPMRLYPARVVEIKEEAYAIMTYSLVFDDEGMQRRYSFQPGQFNMVYLPAIGEVPISVSSAPAPQQPLGHTIRFAGNVTRAIGRLRVGDVVGLRGPYGTAWPLERLRGQDLCIVTGGIGLAPLRPVLYHVMQHRADFGRIFLLYGARTPSDMLYTDEFDSWERQEINLRLTVDRADESWRGNVGVVPMLFYQLRLDPKKTSVLACGPEIMIRFGIYEALARRIPKEQIYVSMERNMKCGVGFCGHCQLGPAFVCREGPVFSYAAIEPFFGVEDF